MLSKLFSHTRNFLLPERCINCFIVISNNQGICAQCWPQLSFISDPQCMRCGVPFEFQFDQNTLCAGCLKQSGSVDQYRAVFAYSGIIKDMILKFKHGDGTYMAPLFSVWLYQKLLNFNLNEATLFVPIPLHWRRLFQRQYNQAAMLAQRTAKISQFKYCDNLLERVRHTPPQGRFSKTERQKNISGAIALNKKYTALIKNKTIVLFDDVLASGATVNECADILKKAGADQVYVLTLARTVLQK